MPSIIFAVFKGNSGLIALDNSVAADREITIFVGHGALTSPAEA